VPDAVVVRPHPPEGAVLCGRPWLRLPPSCRRSANRPDLWSAPSDELFAPYACSANRFMNPSHRRHIEGVRGLQFAPRREPVRPRGRAPLPRGERADHQGRMPSAAGGGAVADRAGPRPPAHGRRADVRTGGRATDRGHRRTGSRSLGSRVGTGSTPATRRRVRDRERSPAAPAAPWVPLGTVPPLVALGAPAPEVGARGGRSTVRGGGPPGAPGRGAVRKKRCPACSRSGARGWPGVGRAVPADARVAPGRGWRPP
jgi:hypothetical protein